MANPTQAQIQELIDAGEEYLRLLAVAVLHPKLEQEAKTERIAARLRLAIAVKAVL